VPEKHKSSNGLNSQAPVVERAQRFRERAKYMHERSIESLIISTKQSPHYSKAYRESEDKVELGLFIQEQDFFDDKSTITDQYDDALGCASQQDIETPRIGIDV